MANDFGFDSSDEDSEEPMQVDTTSILDNKNVKSDLNELEALCEALEEDVMK
jgi:hypothetical protein